MDLIIVYTFPLRLALAYIRGSTRNQSVSCIALISVLSMTVASAALALTLAIMHGFEHATHATFQALYGQITIQAPAGGQLALESLEQCFKKSLPEINVWTPSITMDMVLALDDDVQHARPVSVQSVNIQTKQYATRLADSIINETGQPITAAIALQNTQCVIGSEYARTNNINIDDTVTLLRPSYNESKRNTVTFDEYECMVGGFLKTGIEEFDTHTVLLSEKTALTIDPDAGITQISLTLEPATDEPTTIKKLRKITKLQVYSWKEKYPAIVSALHLEKYVMSTVLLLIVCVAAVAITSLLFMLITLKATDIALLMSIGMSLSHIRAIFIYAGLILSSISGLIGIIIATIMSYALEHGKLVHLPDAYYVTHVPAHMHITIALFTCCAVSIITLLAAWLPTRSLRYGTIARTLQQRI